MIHLSQEEYIELLRAQEKLECLQVGGVDEWQDYYEVMENYVDPAERIKIEAQAKEILDFLASYADVKQDPELDGTFVLIMKLKRLLRECLLKLTKSAI